MLAVPASSNDFFDNERVVVVSVYRSLQLGLDILATSLVNSRHTKLGVRLLAPQGAEMTLKD